MRECLENPQLFGENWTVFILVDVLLLLNTLYFLFLCPRPGYERPNWSLSTPF
jgi:hypothetical protein